MTKRNILLMIVAVLSAAIALPVLAGSATFSGDLATTDPTFNIPTLAPCNTTGVNRRFDTFDFSVNETGDYTIETSAAFLAIAYVYESNFDPGNPNTNCLGFAGSFSLTVPLTAGTNYILVVVGNFGSDLGSYSVTVTGPGEVCTPSCNTAVDLPPAEFVFTDGRINNRDSAAPIAVFSINGNTGLDIWSTSNELLRVTEAEIAAVPTNPASNTVIASNEAAGVFVFRQADGSFLITAPQYNGKTYFMTFNEIGAIAIYDSGEIE